MLLCKVSVQVGGSGSVLWTPSAEVGLYPALKVDCAPLFPQYILSDSLSIQLTHNEWADHCPAAFRHCETHMVGLYEEEKKKNPRQLQQFNLQPPTVCLHHHHCQGVWEKPCPSFELYTNSRKVRTIRSQYVCCGREQSNVLLAANGKWCKEQRQPDCTAENTLPISNLKTPRKKKKQQESTVSSLLTSFQLWVTLALHSNSKCWTILSCMLALLKSNWVLFV